jgi:hypothetical protein
VGQHECLVEKLFDFYENYFTYKHVLSNYSWPCCCRVATAAEEDSYMLGTMRNNYRTPPAADAEADLSQSRNLPTRRGAVMLLALFASGVIVVAIAWGSSTAIQAPPPQTTVIESTIKTPQLQINEKEEQGITMGPEDQIQPITEPTTTANVQVNGESVDLPPTGNGSIHKEIVSDNGSTTTVDIDMNSSTSGTSTRGSSSIQLNVQSSSVTESETE